MKGQTMLRSIVARAGAMAGAMFAVFPASMALATDGGGNGHGFGPHHRDEDIVVFLPLALLIGFAIAAIVMWRRRPGVGPTTQTLNAQAILAERLARGEITPDDYRAAIAVLRDVPPKR
jgi:uncharacterized membrane protein